MTTARPTTSPDKRRCANDCDGLRRLMPCPTPQAPERRLVRLDVLDRLHANGPFTARNDGGVKNGRPCAGADGPDRRRQPRDRPRAGGAYAPQTCSRCATRSRPASWRACQSSADAKRSVRKCATLAALAREFDAKTIDLLVHSAGVSRHVRRAASHQCGGAVRRDFVADAGGDAQQPRIAVLTSDLGTSARDMATAPGLWRQVGVTTFRAQRKFVPICAYSLTKLSANLRALERAGRFRGQSPCRCAPWSRRARRDGGGAAASGDRHDLAHRHE